MMGKTFSFIGLIFLPLLLMGCRPDKTGDANSELPPEILLARLKSAHSRLQDFKGSALVTVRLNGRRSRVSTRIRFRRPDHLKIFVQGGLRVIAVISIKQRAVQLYIPGENVVFEGPIDDTDTLMPGLRVPLSDIRTASTGLIDLAPYVPENITDYRQEGGHYHLSVMTNGRKRTILIDPGRTVVLREEEQIPGGKTIVRTFDQYTLREGIWRPSEIQIESDTQDETLNLKYDMQSLNSGLTGSDLRMKLPGSVRHLPLSHMVAE